MATPRGKKMLRTNTTIKLIKSNPPGRYRTKRGPARLRIPLYPLRPVPDYIMDFTGLNNLKPSEFTINGKVVLA